MNLSGPMFEGRDSGPWKSIHRKDGAHYNTYGCRDENGMAALREFFPDGTGGDLNFCLFSTSGVHGSYVTIEEAEEAWRSGGIKDDDDPDEPPYFPHVTFLIVQPRIVCLRYGNCEPKTEDDFSFLKKLRATSQAAVQTIGVVEGKRAPESPLIQHEFEPNGWNAATNRADPNLCCIYLGGGCYCRQPRERHIRSSAGPKEK